MKDVALNHIRPLVETALEAASLAYAGNEEEFGESASAFFHQCFQAFGGEEFVRLCKFLRHVGKPPSEVLTMPDLRVYAYVYLTALASKENIGADDLNTASQLFVDALRISTGMGVQDFCHLAGIVFQAELPEGRVIH